MPIEDGWRDGHVSRRTYLKLAGGTSALAAGLAGCSENPSGDTQTTAPGDTDDGSTEEPGDEQNEVLDTTFVGLIQQNPTQAQYNEFNTTSQPTEVLEILFDELAGYNQTTGEWEPLLASDWSFDGSTASVVLRDDYTWHDGEPVTATDLQTQMRLSQYNNAPLWEYVSSVETVGDYELELQVSNSVSEEVFMTHLLSTRMSAPDSVFGEKLEAIESAAEGDERNEVLNDELVGWAWEEPIGNGAFEFQGTTAQEIRTSRYADYPGADGINFERYNFRFGSLQERRQMAISGEISGGHPANGIVQVKDQLPDKYEYKSYSGFNGTASFFQHDDSLTGNRAFRKAFGYLIDQTEMSQTVRPEGTQGLTWLPHTVQTGLMEDQTEEWLGDVIDGFDTYEVSTSDATAALEEGGFTKSGDTWNLPSGEKASLEIIVVAGNSVQTGQGDYMAQELNNFGIETNVRAVDFSTFFGSYFATGNYQLLLFIWGGEFPHPYFHFQNEFLGLKDTLSLPDSVEVPMPVGDPDGSMETVNLGEKVTQLGTTTDEAEVKRLVEELAWTFNQTLPVYQNVDAHWVTLLSNDEWEYPALDDPATGVQPASAWLPKVGKLTAKR